MEAPATSPHPHASAIRAQLEKILQRETFRDTQRSSQLLRFIVEAVLQGRESMLKEYTLGAEALGRGSDFDPRSDAIARVEASRLRTRLSHYYATEGLRDDWLIVLPKGTYVPEISLRNVVDSATTRPRAVSLRGLRWPLALAGAGLVLAAFLLWRKPVDGNAPAAPSPMVQMDPGARVEVSSEVGNDLTLSATGHKLVFVGRAPSGGYSLFTRDMAGLEARELPGTGGARVPSLSPDGEWVMYWAEGELRKTRADGTGRPVSVLRTSDALGIDWIDPDNIVVGATPFELVRVDLRSGKTTSLVRAPNARRLIFPQSLQHGELILGTSDEGQVGNAAIELLDVRSGQRTVLVRGAMFGRYVRTGHLLFVRGGTLYAVNMDLDARAIKGEPQPIMEGVAWSPTFGYAQYAVADSGLLLALRGGDGAETQAAWVDGPEARKLPQVSGLLQWPRLSPDGKRLAVMRREAADYDLWLYDLSSGTGRKLADQSQDLQSPVWSNDGQYIAYASRTGGIWWSRDGATGVLMKGRKDPEILVPTSISPDGKWLAYHARGLERQSFDIWVAPIQSGPGGPKTGTPMLYRGTEYFETYPVFSPDGRWIAYASNESGQWEIYVRAFPEDGRALMVSSAGGRTPIWDWRSGTLYFMNADRRLIAADLSLGSGQLAVRSLRSAGTMQLADTGVIAGYDVVNGKILGLLPAEESARSDLVLLTDFRSRLASPAGTRAP